MLKINMIAIISCVLIASACNQITPDENHNLSQTISFAKLKVRPNTDAQSSQLYRDEAKDFLNSNSENPEVYVEKGKELELHVETVIDRFVNSQKPYGEAIEEAIDALLDPNVFVDSGVFLTKKDSPYILESTATVDDFKEFTQLTSGCEVVPGLRNFQDPTQFVLAINVTIIEPVVDNGHRVYSKENQVIADNYLHCITEELLHASQVLQAQLAKPNTENANSFMISDYFKLYDITKVPFLDKSGQDLRESLIPILLVNSYREADVYAKMLEIFGDLSLPEYYETYFYPFRQDLSPKEKVLSKDKPDLYEI